MPTPPSYSLLIFAEPVEKFKLLTHLTTERQSKPTTQYSVYQGATKISIKQSSIQLYLR